MICKKTFINENSSEEVNFNKHEKKKIGVNRTFGFYIYLMSECILFSTLFVTYLTFKINSKTEIPTEEIFNLFLVLLETIFLLLSSFSCEMMIDETYFNQNKKNVIIWLGIAFLFGANFIFLEGYEFYLLNLKGYTLSYNAFLSSFLTIIITHSLHVSFGLLWILFMIIHISYYGITWINEIRLKCLSLFWIFLDIIWICIYTVIYLIGSLS